MTLYVLAGLLQHALTGAALGHRTETHQFVQNLAGHMLMGARRFDLITPILHARVTLAPSGLPSSKQDAGISLYKILGWLAVLGLLQRHERQQGEGGMKARYIE